MSNCYIFLFLQVYYNLTNIYRILSYFQMVNITTYCNIAACKSVILLEEIYKIILILYRQRKKEHILQQRRVGESARILCIWMCRKLLNLSSNITNIPSITYPSMHVISDNDNDYLC